MATDQHSKCMFPGRVFGRLTAVEKLPVEPGRHSSRWLCRCECGTLKRFYPGNLFAGKTLSCGCLQEHHGMSRSPECNVWAHMLQRCLNPKNKQYKNYGGRGIKVCDRWQASFSAFLEDMGTRPSARHEIDRIDNSGNYEPENCRWATKAENRRNTRRTQLITYNGETLCITDWEKRLGMGQGTLTRRIRVYKMSHEEAFSRPVRKHCRKQ